MFNEEDEMKTAKFLTRIEHLRDASGNILIWEIYQLSPMIESNEFVCASASTMFHNDVMFVNEVMIFPALLEDGDWVWVGDDLSCLHDSNDHVKALNELGYRVIGRPDPSLGKIDVPLLES